MQVFFSDFQKFFSAPRTTGDLQKMSRRQRKADSIPLQSVKKQ
jgi:hypothetical protein